MDVQRLRNIDNTFALPGGTKCPHCGHEVTHADGDGEEGPSEGMISICIACAQAALFTADRSLRAPTVSEQLEIDSNSEVQRAIGHVKAAIARGKARRAD